MNGLCDLCQAPATVGAFCTACLGQLTSNARHASRVLKELETTIAKLDHQAPTQRGGGGERGLVFNLHASDVATELLAALRAVARAADPLARRVYDTHPAALAYVVTITPESVARHPNAGDMATRLKDALEAGNRAIDCTPDRRVIGNCECGHILATARKEGTLTCRNPDCGKEWDIAHSVISRAMDTREHIATPEQAAGLISTSFGVKLTKDGVKNWIKRGHLKPAEEGTYRVRIGDVMDLYESKHGPLPGRAA